MTTASVMRLTMPMAKYSFGSLPQVPGIVKSQFLAIGRQIKNRAIILEMFHRTMRTAMTLVLFAMEEVGMSAVYISRTDSLLNMTVAFHKRAKDRIP